MSAEGARHRSANELMMIGPGLPDRASPRQRPVLVVSQIVSIDEMHDVQFARPVNALEHREVVPQAQDTAQQVRRLSGRHLVFKHRTKPGEVDEHRLAITPVVAIAGMLRHVCVNDEAMRGGVPELERLVGLDLPKELPAPGCTRNILVHRSGYVGHSRSALGTGHGLASH